MVDWVVHHLRAGGWVMWWILACHVMVVVLSIERIVFAVRARVGTEAVARELVRWIQGTADASLALGSVDGLRRRPMGRIAEAGLLRACASLEQSRVAMDAARLDEVARAERRTGLIKPLIDVAVLLGFLGVLFGLICPPWHSPDAGSRAAALAHSIGEAMGSTLFGLYTAIVGIALRACVVGQTERFVQDLDAGVAAVRNALQERSRSLRFGDVRLPPVTATYRS